jgi:hypothetical protein
MALGLTQALTKMSYRNNSWGGGGDVLRRPVRMADNLHVQIVFKSGSLILLEPYGPFQACNGIALPVLM